MENFSGKRILIFQQRGWGTTIGHFLAQKIQAQGVELGAITFKKTTDEFIKNQSQVNYTFIASNDEVVENPHGYLGTTTYSLSEICRELNIESVWPMVHSLRTHVKSYADKYYYSFRQNINDEGIIEYVKALYHLIVKTFSEFKPDLIITPNFVSLPHIMFNYYAREHGITMLGVTDSKVKGNYIFAYDHQDGSGPFHERFKELNEGSAFSINQVAAQRYIQEFRTSFKTPDALEKISTNPSILRRVRHELAPYYHILQWYLKPQINHLHSVGITPDYRPPRIILRDHYTHARNKKHAERFDYYPFEKIGKAVYFPLQFQPESSIDVAAPYFSNQIETARLVAMSLPQDYTLIVKEHPAMIGYRSASYLEKISRTVNVKLIDFRIPSQIVLQKASLIISPNSTTIAEAALLKKPVIQLGDLGTTLLLPNTVKHTDLTTLSKKILEVLQKPLNTPEYEQRLINYVAAVYDTGFTADYLAAWEKGGTAKLEAVWEAYKPEIKKLLA